MRCNDAQRFSLRCAYAVCGVAPRIIDALWDRFLGVIETKSMDEHDADILAKYKLRRKLSYEVRRIAEDQEEIGWLDVPDGDFAQYLDYIVERCEEEDNTDTESERFVNFVIQELP